jgi:hypothetical protein
MADDIVWEICRNHYLIVECPYITDWRNTLIIQESRSQVDLLEATENVKLCNWDHYIQTKGWIAPPVDGPTNRAET